MFITRTGLQVFLSSRISTEAPSNTRKSGFHPSVTRITHAKRLASDRLRATREQCLHDPTAASFIPKPFRCASRLHQMPKACIILRIAEGLAATLFWAKA
jgi:hypothetical protein